MDHAELIVLRARQVGAGGASRVPSPCISVCRMDPATQWCEGCFRTLDEIAAWARMQDEGKREVWRLIGQRALSRAAAPVLCGSESTPETAGARQRTQDGPQRP
jgi:hypothetical protein